MTTNPYAASAPTAAWGVPGGTDDLALTAGVRRRRCLAWLVDLAVIAAILAGLWVVLFLFGLLTLGLGMPLLGLLPVVPFLYHFISLVSGLSASPGQAMFGLIVRRDDDLGPPTALQALVCILLYYLTLATTGLLLMVALFTTRKRTLHDIFSGLVVIRRRPW